MPAEPIPGHTLVTRRAVADIVRTAVLGSYGVTGFAGAWPERLIARKDLVHGLENGQFRLGLRLKLTHAQRDALADDASGDALDAVLCLIQAAWAQTRHEAGDALYGLLPAMDAVEGWIVSA